MKVDRVTTTGPDGCYMETTHLSLGGEFEHSEYITVTNDGENIVATNYFDLPMAQMGFFFLARNGDADCLLVPDSQIHFAQEMKTGKHCVITSGVYCGRESIEIMFDDRSNSPFVLYLSLNQCSGSARRRKGPSKLSVWTRDGKAGEWTAYQRNGRKLPNLQPWV